MGSLPRACSKATRMCWKAGCRVSTRPPPFRSQVGNMLKLLHCVHAWKPLTLSQAKRTAVLQIKALSRFI